MVAAGFATTSFRSTERSLGVDHPAVTEQDSETGGEAAWLSERCEMSMELELAFMERCLEACGELAAEDATEHLDPEAPSMSEHMTSLGDKQPPREW